MAVLEVKKSASKVSISKNVEISIPDGVKVKHTGVYDFIDTSNEGIKKVVSKQGGYLVFLDYGRVLKTNKRTGLKELKQDKTIKRVNSEAEAKKLKAEAELIRKQRREKGPEASLETHKASKITMEQVVKNFKAEGEYRDMSVDYQMHFDNYCNHILDYFRDFEPCKITTIDIENFFKYQLENGCLYDNRVGAEKGLSINTLGKHKTALKKIWNYMIKAKKYGVSENIVIIANLPKVEVEVDGKKKKVAKIPYVPKSLTLDELNYTLNDIAQNEFDRSLLLLVAMCSIGGLRRGEITALQLGKYYHNDLMNVSDEIFDYSGYDKKYYEEHDEFIMIDSEYKVERGKEIIKLPKNEKVRVVAKPQVLKEIIEYCMEQREQICKITGKVFISTDQMYLPLVNIIRGDRVRAEKITRKWALYQERRNKRMRKAGLEPIKIIRLHDLRHTHANLLKMDVVEWQISLNMGHKLQGSTTSRVYWDDSIPVRKHIIQYFDENIHIDWDKVMRREINMTDSKARLNNNGQLIIGDYEKLRLKSIRRKPILSEAELEELLSSTETEYKGLLS